MTIQVSITNDDSREKAIVAVASQNSDGSEMSGVPIVELAGGESTTVTVHSGKQILIEEVSNG